MNNTQKEKSCIDCKYFYSYQAMHEDELEPHDSGVCQAQKDIHVSERHAIDCNIFKEKLSFLDTSKISKEEKDKFKNDIIQNMDKLISMFTENIEDLSNSINIKHEVNKITIEITKSNFH